MSATSNTYPGKAHIPDSSGQELTGELTVLSDRLHFRTSQGETDHLPLQGLQVKIAGATGDLPMFSHPNYPGLVLWSTDRRIMEEPALLALPGVKSQKRRLNSRFACCGCGCLAVIILLALGLAALVFAKDSLVNVAAARIPVEWEIKLGDLAFRQISASNSLLKDAVLEEQVNRIVQPLLAAIPEKDRRYPFKVHLSPDAEPNAFALPGGNIVINLGLLELADNPEQVAGVLAHEIAHVTHRHTIRSFINTLGLYVVLQGMLGNIADLGLLTEGSRFLLEQSYSRDFEREADRIGWNYLQNANINPEGLKQFFQKLRALPGRSEDGAVMKMLSTHPATDERIQWLEKQTSDVRPGDSPLIDVQWAILKGRIFQIRTP